MSPSQRLRECFRTPSERIMGSRASRKKPSITTKSSCKGSSMVPHHLDISFSTQRALCATSPKFLLWQVHGFIPHPLPCHSTKMCQGVWNGHYEDCELRVYSWNLPSKTDWWKIIIVKTTNLVENLPWLVLRRTEFLIRQFWAGQWYEPQNRHDFSWRRVWLAGTECSGSGGKKSRAIIKADAILSLGPGVE